MKGVRCRIAVGQYAAVHFFFELASFRYRLFMEKERKSLTLTYLRQEGTDTPEGYLVRYGAMRHGIN
jgi:hypothetical protein